MSEDQQGRHHHRRFPGHRRRPRRRVPAARLGGRGHLPDDQARRGPGRAHRRRGRLRPGHHRPDHRPGRSERFGRIDTLVNNAGVFLSKPFTDYTADDYAAVVGVNLTGFFWLTQRAIAEMLKRGSGHVVNITTTLVDNASSSTPSVLTALTKGGLAAATRSLAIEYASRGIRVNAVSPGIIQTPVHPAGKLRRRSARSFRPSGTWARSATSSNGILFLESSPFITGEILHIDGGQIAGH